NQAAIRPTLQGVMAQASTYGATIPDILGCTMSAPLLIWLNGIRKAASSKKGSKKGGVSTFRACADLLLGHNPIAAPMACIASNLALGLHGASVTTGYPLASYTISDANYYELLAVTVTLPYSVTFNDYGGGSFSLSGNFELPLWNLALRGPDP